MLTHPLPTSPLPQVDWDIIKTVLLVVTIAKIGYMSDATHFGKKEAFVQYMVYPFLTLAVLEEARAISERGGSIYDLNITSECSPRVHFMSIGGNTGKKDTDNAEAVFERFSVGLGL